MSQLMSDPIDHWLDLDTQPPRNPLRAELWDAVNQAVDSTGLTRAYWTGVTTGYQVAFGLLTSHALDKARLVPRVFVANPLTNVRFSDEEHAWACGVLYGYKQGTSERTDADECLNCEQRLLDSDDTDSCEHGRFCYDCATDWHRPTDGLGLCAYLDARRADA